MQLRRAALRRRVMYARVSNTLQDVAACVAKKAAKQIEKPDAWELGMARTRLLAFHWALASHVVRVAVVHLQLPPWFRVGVHCGRGGQWRAVVCLYMHLKVGRGGETWDQRNREQGSCLTYSGFHRGWTGFAGCKRDRCKGHEAATPTTGEQRLRFVPDIYINHSTVQ